MCMSLWSMLQGSSGHAAHLRVHVRVVSTVGGQRGRHPDARTYALMQEGPRLIGTTSREPATDTHQPMPVHTQTRLGTHKHTLAHPNAPDTSFVREGAECVWGGGEASPTAWPAACRCKHPHSYLACSVKG